MFLDDTSNVFGQSQTEVAVVTITPGDKSDDTNPPGVRAAIHITHPDFGMYSDFTGEATSSEIMVSVGISMGVS